MTQRKRATTTTRIRNATTTATSIKTIALLRTRLDIIYRYIDSPTLLILIIAIVAPTRLFPTTTTTTTTTQLPIQQQEHTNKTSLHTIMADTVIVDNSTTTTCDDDLETLYNDMLGALRTELDKQLPTIDPVKWTALLEAHAHKKASFESCQIAAEPILSDLDDFLSNGRELDYIVVEGAILATGTPKGLAAFAKQGPHEKQLLDNFLGNEVFMKEVLLAGGAKSGRYGKALQIRHDIVTQYPRAANPEEGKGVFYRLGLAVALEFAAPELCGYKDVDPIKRYAFYEESYLNGDLIPQFESLSTFLLRQVVNDPYTEDDMRWMRDMLWNYRPDQITVVDEYNTHVVGLMYSEFGHKKAETNDTWTTTKFQQFIDRGGQCGPKAFFGRCLGRSFGIPVFGCRLRKHTGMSYWTPKQWHCLLGVSLKTGFWNADRSEPMNGHYFLGISKSREDPSEFVKACRADWISSILGEEKVQGLEPFKVAGTWSMVAMNKRSSIALALAPDLFKDGKKDLTFGYPERVERLSAPEELKAITTDEDTGIIHIPAVACTSPTTSTDKIVFMKTRTGGMNLHYKRWEVPEPFTYEVTVPNGGDYELSMDVVTVNRDQFFLVSTNASSAESSSSSSCSASTVRMELPYTIGQWGVSTPVTLTLEKGPNVLTLTRSVPSDIDFTKEAYKFAGPEFGGITLQELRLKEAV